MVKLSICIATMNRCFKLENALHSCLYAQLPIETEFVVVDNASTDRTRDTVKEVLGKSGYAYKYFYSDVNLGAGGGRNKYFELAEGTYIYGMDDDAIVADKDFFLNAIEIMDRHPEIGALATQIYDEAWGRNRYKGCGKEIYPGIYSVFMFSGGSHFLRKDAFEDEPYLSNQFGFEELPPSLYVVSKGMKNALAPSLLAIHQPEVDKWNVNSAGYLELAIKSCTIPYVIKKKIYPSVFKPLLWLGLRLRFRKHIPRELQEQAYRDIKEQECLFKFSFKLKLLDVVKLIFEFKGPAV